MNFEWLKTGSGDPYFQKKTKEKKHEILADEMLNIKVSTQKQSAHLVNEALLAEILSKILTINAKKRLSISKISNAIAGIYSDMVFIEKSPEIQLRMVEPAIKAFIRYT